MERHLHIISLEIPWPASCGNTIDVLNRIKAFKENGIKIHLHYFDNDHAGIPNELNLFCESIHVYKRKKLAESFSLSKPSTVNAVINQKLIETLAKDNHPLLLEGMQCTGILKALPIQQRKVCVRMHNEEGKYYNELARCSSSLTQKLYYSFESRLIKAYETSLPKDCMYACVSKTDAAHFKSIGMTDSRFIPVFTAWKEIDCPDGIGNFCLYQGNLCAPENEKAALWLLNKVFTKVRVPFLIAGKNPGKRLQKAASLCQHTCLISNPGEAEINDLINKAHINVLPCFNKEITGIRSKLLHALFKGRHCVVTDATVAGTGLEGACHIGKTPNAFASIISQLYYQPFEQEEVRLRSHLLSNTYNNDQNIKEFIQYLW